MSQVRNGKPSDKIDFIHTMLSELRLMAETERCDMLAYLIGMAEVEANDIVMRNGRRLGVPGQK